MKEVALFAPEWYWKLPKKEREKGRCGAGNGLGEKLVPETNWGLSMTPACQIHDKMYAAGKTIDDKDEADRAFFNNMLRLIDGNTSFILLRWMRRQRALVYYNAVKDFGGPAFWANKNKPEEWGLVPTTV